MHEALEKSDGLCLSHLRLILEHLKDKSMQADLLSIQQGKMEKLQAELRRIHPQERLPFYPRGFGAERDAWRRAVAMGAGSKK